MHSSATARNDPGAAETPPSRAALIRAIDSLVEECRVASLWYYRQGYYPKSDRARLRILEAIQERSSRDVFRRAGVLKAWLSRLSKDESASS